MLLYKQILNKEVDMKRSALIILLLATLFLVNNPAYAFIGKKIKSYEYIDQPLNKTLITNVGAPIIKISIKENLPNAFGRADVFGGKVDKSYKLLSYMGLNPDGTIKLKIFEASIMSNETTMTRYGGNASYVNLNHSANKTYGTINHVQKNEAQRDILPTNTIDFNFDYKKKDNFVFGNKTIKIIDVDEFNLKYIITEQEI